MQTRDSEGTQGTAGEAPGLSSLASLPAVLTVRELATVLRVGRNKAYELVKAGGIGSRRFGGSIRIPRAAVERLLEEGDRDA